MKRVCKILLQKSYYETIPGSNISKLFYVILQKYLLLRQCPKLPPKSIITLAPEANVIKLFTVVICECPNKL